MFVVAVTQGNGAGGGDLGQLAGGGAVLCYFIYQSLRILENIALWYVFFEYCSLVRIFSIIVGFLLLSE